MKNSIGYQLFSRVLIIVFFILMLAIAGQICISFLDRTSSKVFTEYVEMDAIQEYRTKLNHLIIHFDNFAFTDNFKTREELENSIADCYKQFEICNEVLTNRHNRDLLIFFKKGLIELDSLKHVLFSTQVTTEQLYQIQNEIISVVNEGNKIS